MLVLSRKRDEIIYLHRKNIFLASFQILDITKGNVRIGITAPEDISIYRKEIYERIQEEKNLDKLK